MCIAAFNPFYCQHGSTTTLALHLILRHIGHRLHHRPQPLHLLLTPNPYKASRHSLLRAHAIHSSPSSTGVGGHTYIRAKLACTHALARSTCCFLAYDGLQICDSRLCTCRSIQNPFGISVHIARSMASESENTRTHTDTKTWKILYIRIGCDLENRGAIVTEKLHFVDVHFQATQPTPWTNNHLL